jgi:hypothetical protein
MRAQESAMRVLLCCIGLMYGSGSIIDTELIKPAQGPGVDQILTEQAPPWFGETARNAKFDGTD